MKNTLLKVFFLAFVCCIHSGQLKAQQQLVLELVNGTVENYPLSEIRSIKFGSASMIIRNISGTQQTRNINNIVKYTFQDVSASSDVVAAHTRLFLFPNPVREWLELDFASSSSGTIKAEIVSLTGLALQTVFEGFHPGNIKLRHPVKGLPAGMYFCRMAGEAGTLVKPFFIQ